MAHWIPIPGETPIDDISGLIPRGIATRSELNLCEAENIRIAVVRYLAAKPSRRQAPFTLPWLYKLHGQMFGRVWTWAGKKRTTDLNLGVPPPQIELQLQSLLDDLFFWRDSANMALLEQAARLHHRAVYIHPFLNGNGRWARLLSNIWLKLHAHPLTYWPDATVGEESTIRNEYLAAIRAADQNDLAALLELHRRFTAAKP